MTETFFTGFALIILLIVASLVCIGVVISAIIAIGMIIKIFKEVFRKDE